MMWLSEAAAFRNKSPRVCLLIICPPLFNFVRNLSYLQLYFHLIFLYPSAFFFILLFVSSLCIIFCIPVCPDLHTNNRLPNPVLAHFFLLSLFLRSFISRPRSILLGGVMCFSHPCISRSVDKQSSAKFCFS